MNFQNLYIYDTEKKKEKKILESFRDTSVIEIIFYGNHSSLNGRNSLFLIEKKERKILFTSILRMFVKRIII